MHHVAVSLLEDGVGFLHSWLCGLKELRVGAGPQDNRVTFLHCICGLGQFGAGAHLLEVRAWSLQSFLYCLGGLGLVRACW